MRIHVFPPSGRIVGIIALTKHLDIECEQVSLDLQRGDQHSTGYAALNSNRKAPTLEDENVVLWESNAILFYLAAKRPSSGVWPTDVASQADVLRWLCWESAHWDAESIGMVAYEKGSKAVLGLGSPDPAFVTRGEQNFQRFAAVLDDSLREKRWLVRDRLTIADFSIGGLVPSARRMGLPVTQFPEVCRWYEGLASMVAWRDALATRDAALASWLSGANTPAS